MACEKPVVLQSKGLRVPCGRCFSCRRRRAAEWASRLMHEMPYWKFSNFVTLTYSDEFLPPLNDLRIEDYQLFLKQLRHVFGRFKYMIAGEYGDLRGRAHWHLALFSNVFDSDVVTTTWGRGFTYSVPLSFKSCFYICMYMAKAYHTLYGSRPGVYNFSKGLGKTYVLDHEDELRSNLSFVRDDGLRQSLLRQYRVWLGIDESNFGGYLEESREASRRRLLALVSQTAVSGWVGRLVVSSAHRARLSQSRYLSGRIK